MNPLYTRRLAGCLAAAVVLPLLTGAPPSGAATADPPRRVIVLLDGLPAAAHAPAGRLGKADKQALARSRSQLSAAQDGFLQRARSAGLRPVGVQKHTLLLNAVTLTIPASQQADLARQPGVRSVHLDEQARVMTDVSVPLVGAPDVWKTKDSQGVNATGAGVTVAVIDSGVDYTHPDLGAGLGAGHKVVGGHDFVNDDDDPMDDHGHGTHVAGIIAAQAAAPGGVTGMAPDASIVAYKVADEWGYGSTDDLIAAFEAAVDPAGPHPADVINISMGNPGDGSDPVALAAAAAVESGTVVVASAGNEGPSGDTLSSPSVAGPVISVGASTSNVRNPEVRLGTERLQTYKGLLSAQPSLRAVTADLVDVGRGTPEELDAAGDLHGRIALFDGHVASEPWALWGPEVDAQREVERRGAVALIGGYSTEEADGGGIGVGAATSRVGGADLHDAGEFDPMGSLVLMGVDETQYAELARALDAGPVRLALVGRDMTDSIASFSSRGPTADFRLKPDLVAPGVQILSTVPTALLAEGRYRMSGTSMAAPHVAGAAALLRQLTPDEAPATVKARLMGASVPLDGTSPTSGGAGRLDVAAAAAATVTATPPSISLGLADQSKDTIGGSAELTLHNGADTAVTADLAADGSKATVTPRRLTIPAGGSATVRVAVSAARPSGWDEISGSVSVTVAGDLVSHVPYLLVSRPLDVNFTEDPSDGTTRAWVYSPAPPASAPTLRVTPDNGSSFTLATTRSSDHYWWADVSVAAEGDYTVTARATTSDGVVLVGSGGFSVTPEASRKNVWTPVGPNSLGGDLTVAPSDPDVAVVLEDDEARPWLTTDGGTTWQQVPRLPVVTATGTGSLVIDRRDAREWWYALTDAGSGRSPVLHTTDAGATWESLDLPTSDRVTHLVGDSAGGTLVALTDRNGLLVSRDRGATWTLTPALATGSATRLAVSGDAVYLATGRQVWRRAGLSNGTLGDAVLLQDLGRTGIVYGLAADDSAAIWTVLGQGVFVHRASDGAPVKVMTRSSGFSGLFASGGDLVVGLTSGTAEVTRDQGTTWASVPRPISGAALLDYDHWGDGTISQSLTSGIYRSAPDGSGSHRIGIQGRTVNDLATSGSGLLAATDSGVYRTTVPADQPEWGHADGEGYVGAGANQLSVSPASSEVVIKTRQLAWDQFGVDRSADGGRTWEQVGLTLGTPLALAISPADPQRAYVGFGHNTGSGLYVTKDGGATWKKLYHGMWFGAVAPDPSNPNRVWLGNSAGLWRSDDGGVTVTRVISGRVASIHVEGKRIVVGGDGVRLSTDGGTKFVAAHIGSIPVHVVDLVETGGVLYAAASSYVDIGITVGPRGVYRSTDGGKNWSNVSGTLRNLDARALTASADGAWLYVGTDGGVHRLPLT